MAEYWGAERIGQRLGVARSTVWEWIDRGRLLAFTQRRGSRAYLWTDDALINLGNVAQAKIYIEQRRKRKALREALRARQRPTDPPRQPPSLARTADQDSGDEKARALERPQGCLDASMDAVAHVPPIRIGGPVAEEQGARPTGSAISDTQSA